MTNLNEILFAQHGHQTHKLLFAKLGVLPSGLSQLISSKIQVVILAFCLFPAFCCPNLFWACIHCQNHLPSQVSVDTNEIKCDCLVCMRLY